MDSFRKNGLHLFEEKASSNKRKGLDMASFGDTVISLIRLLKHGCTRRTAPGNTPRQLSTTSPFRVEACLLTWEICGGVAALKALDFDGDVEMDSAEEEEWRTASDK